jgi:hypothetical protein
MLYANRPTQLARQLMDLLFTKEEMATCSVTGKPGNKASTKPSLDQNKVGAIIGMYIYNWVICLSALFICFILHMFINAV